MRWRFSRWKGFPTYEKGKAIRENKPRIQWECYTYITQHIVICEAKATLHNGTPNMVCSCAPRELLTLNKLIIPCSGVI